MRAHDRRKKLALLVSGVRAVYERLCCPSLPACGNRRPLDGVFNALGQVLVMVHLAERSTAHIPLIDRRDWHCVITALLTEPRELRVGFSGCAMVSLDGPVDGLLTPHALVVSRDNSLYNSRGD